MNPLELFRRVAGPLALACSVIVFIAYALEVGEGAGKGAGPQAATLSIGK